MKYQLVFNILSTGLSTGEVENFFSSDGWNELFCRRFGAFLELKLLYLSKIVELKLLYLSKIVIFAPLYNIEKMKKVVRTVWIGALSGLAFLAACCSQNGLTRKERKQLVKERDSIQAILTSREGSVVYGTPEIMARRAADTYRLQSQLDSINAKLGEEVDLEKSARRVALQERIVDLQAALQRREGACVYGSPEIIEEYGKETQRLRSELEAVRQELKELNQE